MHVMAIQANKSYRVRTLTGKEIELDIEPDYKVCSAVHHLAHGYRISRRTANANTHKVSRIKERVEEKEGIPPAQQRLIYGGKQMYVPRLTFL